MGNSECIKQAAATSSGHWIPVLTQRVTYVRGKPRKFVMITAIEGGERMGTVISERHSPKVYTGQMDDVASKCSTAIGLEYEEVPHV